jgi:ComF family protein
MGYSPLIYTGSVRELLHLLKYQSRYELGEPFGYIMGAAADFASEWNPDALVPVPLHPDRLERRGYNQAELLAQGAARFLHIPVMADAVLRVRATPPQNSLSPHERKQNMQGAFYVQVPSKVAGRKILMVDDVHTTGATLNALGLELMHAGAESVRFVTLAVAVNPQALTGNLLE